MMIIMMKIMMRIMENIDIMDTMVIMDMMYIMEITEIMDIMNITAWMAMAGAVSALVYLKAKKSFGQSTPHQLEKGGCVGLYLLDVRHLDLNIHSVPEYPGENPGAVLSDQQQHAHLADHLQDKNGLADFLDVDLMRCLGFRYVYCAQEYVRKCQGHLS